MRNHQESGKLTNVEVGYAKADITPSRSAMLAGFGFRDGPSIGVESPLYIRTLFFQGSDGCYAVSSCDLIALTKDMVEGILAEVSDLGLSHENYLIAATHTHSGPTTMLVAAPIMHSMDEEWKAEFIKAAVRSLREAASSTSEAEVAVGRGVLKGIAVNRRAVDPDGKIHFVPDRINYGGVVDEELTTIWLRPASSNRTVCISSFSCHLVSFATKNSEERALISSDFPGVAAKIVSQEGVELVHFSGAFGNINPIYICGGREKCSELGARYASALRDQLSNAKFRRLETLRFAYRSSDLATEKPLSEDELRRLRAEHLEILNNPGDRIWEEIYHVQQMIKYCEHYLERRARGEQIPDSVHVNTYAIGLENAVIVGHPFEMFVEINLRLKERFPDRIILSAGVAGPRLGYLPTEKAHREGGYEVERAHIGDLRPAPYKPETEHIILDEMTEAVKSVINHS